MTPALSVMGLAFVSLVTCADALAQQTCWSDGLSGTRCSTPDGSTYMRRDGFGNQSIATPNDSFQGRPGDSGARNPPGENAQTPPDTSRGTMTPAQGNYDTGTDRSGGRAPIGPNDHLVTCRSNWIGGEICN